MKAAAPSMVAMRRDQVGPRRRWWRSWRLWVLVADMLVLCGALAVQRWPVLKIRHVTVNSPSIWESRVMGVVQTSLPADSNIFSMDVGNLNARLGAELGSLATCRTSLALPGVLTIDIVPTPLTLWTEGGMGVGVDGSLLVTPAVEKVAPIWRPGLGEEGGRLTADRAHAAGAWAEVIAADPRYTGAISEWGGSSKAGWTMVGVDGQTRVNLGSNDLTARALNVSTLLAQSDTILAQPCVVDARFDGQMIVSRIPKPAAAASDSVAGADSSRTNSVIAAPAQVKDSPKLHTKVVSKNTMKAKAKAKTIDRSKSKHIQRGGA